MWYKLYLNHNKSQCRLMKKHSSSSWLMSFTRSMMLIIISSMFLHCWNKMGNKRRLMSFKMLQDGKCSPNYGDLLVWSKRERHFILTFLLINTDYHQPTINRAKITFSKILCFLHFKTHALIRIHQTVFLLFIVIDNMFCLFL